MYVYMLCVHVCAFMCLWVSVSVYARGSVRCESVCLHVSPRVCRRLWIHPRYVWWVQAQILPPPHNPLQLPPPPPPDCVVIDFFKLLNCYIYWLIQSFIISNNTVHFGNHIAPVPSWLLQIKFILPLKMSKGFSTRKPGAFSGVGTLKLPLGLQWRKLKLLPFQENSISANSLNLGESQNRGLRPVWCGLTQEEEISGGLWGQHGITSMASPGCLCCPVLEAWWMRGMLVTSVLALREVTDERGRDPGLPPNSRVALQTRFSHDDTKRVSQGGLWDQTALGLPWVPVLPLTSSSIQTWLGHVTSLRVCKMGIRAPHVSASTSRFSEEEVIPAFLMSFNRSLKGWFIVLNAFIWKSEQLHITYT